MAINSDFCPQALGSANSVLKFEYVVDSDGNNSSTMTDTDLTDRDIVDIPDMAEEDGYEFDSIKIPDIVTPDEMNESGYQEGSEKSYGDRRDSKEGFGGEGDSDSGVDGVSSGCSTADDCPVVSVNDVVAYYDDIRPRRRYVPQLNFYSLDIEKMAMDAVNQVSIINHVFLHSFCDCFSRI